MFCFDTIVPIGKTEGRSESTSNSGFKESEKNPHNFTRNELLSSSSTSFIEQVATTERPTAISEMAKNLMNSDVKQKLIASLPDNDYQSMKRAFDTFNDKMDLYMNFYSNEMSFLTTKLNNVKDKLNTLDTLHHEIDQVTNRQNTAEQKLNEIQEAISGSQSINSKLDQLELSMQQLHVRIDELMEKQRQSTAPSMQTKQYKPADDPLADSDDCESKIEQLVGFVHSFAELNRLESTDILNRLGNMQSQLIQFFDVKGLIPTNQRNTTSTMEQDFQMANTEHSISLNDTNTIQDATETNSTHMTTILTESNEMPSTLLNQSDDTKLSISNQKSMRQYKRMTNRVS